MSILDQVAGIVASAAGPVLFKDGTLATASGRTSDGRGGFTETMMSAACKALVSEYTRFMRTQAGIPSTDKKVLVLGDGLSAPPAPGDIIGVDGGYFKIIETAVDPAGAVYECQGRPCSAPTLA